jgi:hypothetical protein
MSKQWLPLLFLLAVTPVGCRKDAPPAPEETAPVASSTDKQQKVPATAPDAEAIAQKLASAFDKKYKELKDRLDREFAILYLICPRGGKQAPSYDALRAQVEPLLDDPKNQSTTLTGGGALFTFQVAPVRDVEALAARMSLGRVLACDLGKRALLVEYGAKPSTKKEWGDAAFLDRQLMLRKVENGMYGYAGMLGKEMPPEHVVTLLILDVGKHSGVGDLLRSLRGLLDGPEAKRRLKGELVLEGGGGSVIGPVHDLDALVGKINFAEVVAHDKHLRVLVLRPRKPAPPGPPK